MKQTILTFITGVEPGRVNELSHLLEEIADDVMHNPHLPFTSLKLLHFASLVLHQDQSYGSYLIFENNFDGPLDHYLEDLYGHAAEALQCCGKNPRWRNTVLVSSALKRLPLCIEAGETRCISTSLVWGSKYFPIRSTKHP